MAQQHDVAATMGWLAGCWAAEGKEFGSGETWLQPAGGTMLGVGRTIRSGRTVDFEFMRITTNTEGRLIFVAIPSGQRQTTFIATTTGPDEAVFENPEHDFPQRVMYRKRGSDAAVARIEGLRGGVVRGIDFPMRRVSCEPAK
jgi:hypothetical protein